MRYSNSSVAILVIAALIVGLGAGAFAAYSYKPAYKSGTAPQIKTTATTTTYYTTATPTYTTQPTTTANYSGFCKNTTASNTANSYLISIVGQDYFNNHYSISGINTTYNPSYPIVCYNYTLNNFNVQGESNTNCNIHSLMGVVLNSNCAVVVGAAAVLSQINSSITLQQAQSIAQLVAAKDGYNITNVTAGFLPTPQYTSASVNGTIQNVSTNTTELTPSYYVQTSTQCTSFMVAVNGTPSAISTTCP